MCVCGLDVTCRFATNIYIYIYPIHNCFNASYSIRLVDIVYVCISWETAQTAGVYTQDSVLES